MTYRIMGVWYMEALNRREAVNLLLGDAWTFAAGADVIEVYPHTHQPLQDDDVEEPVE